MSKGPIDRQAAFSGTKEATGALALDTAHLEAYLSDTVDDFSGPLTASQFKGGQSNPTYRLDTPTGSYVLRRKPPGNLLPSAHAVEREYRVMKALGSAGFPVPRVRVLCEDESIAGTVFFVMDFVDGRVFWEPSMPGSSPAERGAVYAAMNRTLAKLHSFDPETFGLGDYGRPDGYVARQTARWTKQYRASQTDDIEAMDRLIDWLPKSIPTQRATSIVHGDFRLDNLIIAADGTDVLAVIDWELSTLGDPLADFTYHLMQWVMPPAPDGAGVGSLQGHDLKTLGIPLLDQYVSAYCDQRGIDGIPDLDTYLAYNFFRMAAIFQGIAGRVRDGTATSAAASAMAGQVRPMAETAWAFARKAGA